MRRQRRWWRRWRRRQQLTITPSDHKSIKDRSLQIFVDSSFGAKRFLILANHALLRDKRRKWEHVTTTREIGSLQQRDHSTTFLSSNFSQKSRNSRKKMSESCVEIFCWLWHSWLDRRWSISAAGTAWLGLNWQKKGIKSFYFSLWLISFSSWFDDDFCSLFLPLPLLLN